MNDRSLTNLTKQLTPVAIAIIYQNDKYLMQLRDNFPHIANPGVWGLFGGHIESGEDPEAGLKRELIEEINYPVEQLRGFRCYADNKVIRYVFSCPLVVSIDQLELNEGWDFGLLTIAEINSGYGYSQKSGQSKPLGAIHRQIMLDFIALAGDIS